MEPSREAEEFVNSLPPEGRYRLFMELPSLEGLDDVDDEALELYYRGALGKGLPDGMPFDKKALLSHLGLLHEGKYLTNAGRLLFSNKKPVTLRMAVFATRTKLTFLDIHTLSGNIYSLIGEGERYVMRNINWRAETKGFARVETPEVPREAVREIVVNCLAHADYLSRSGPEIDIFKDRISISNPGRFPKGHDPEEYAREDVAPFARNQKICEVLRLGSLMETRGRGLRRVYSLCEEQKVAVAYEKEKDGFCFMFLRGKRKGQGHKADGSPLSPLEGKILDEMADNPNITLMALASLTKKSMRQVQRVVNSLREERILYRVGSRKRGHWVVNL